MTSSNGNIFRVTGPLCGEFTGPGEFPAQRPVTRSFDVFFDLRLNKRLSKKTRSWWFETLSWSLWRHCNGVAKHCLRDVKYQNDEKTLHYCVTKWKHFPRYWLCEGNPPVTGGFPSQRPVTRSFDVFSHLPLNGWAKNQDAGDLWRHRTHHDVTAMLNIDLLPSRLFEILQWSWNDSPVPVAYGIPGLFGKKTYNFISCIYM